jgi:hypothetical protein
MSTFSTCTSATRPGSPTDGDVLFETDTKNVIVYDGTNWRGYQNDGASFKTNSYSALFDGTNDYIDTNNKFDFIQQTCNFSITFWLKFTAYTTDVNQFLVANSHAYIWYDNRSSQGSPKKLRIRVLPDFSFDVSNAISDNNWHHIAATCAAGGNIKLYRDGSQILSATAPQTNSSSSTDTLKIGANSNSTSPFGGYLDEVAIFNRELTSTEVSNIVGSSKLYPQFTSFYRLENNANDETGVNNGTNNGATFVTSTKPY